jgi:hypothetical protein
MKLRFLVMFLLTSLLFLPSPSLATASPVKIQSSNFHVWGFVNINPYPIGTDSDGQFIFSDRIYDDYDISSKYPVISPWMSIVGVDSLGGDSFSSAHYFGTSVYADDSSNFGYSNAWAEAVSVSRFIPVSTFDQINFIVNTTQSPNYTAFSGTLKDLSTGEELWNVYKNGIDYGFNLTFGAIVNSCV